MGTHKGKKHAKNTHIVYDVSGLDLLRTVGNELKLPLMHISNAASLLNEGEYTEQEREAQYAQLEMSSRRMLQLIDSMLFAGQVETRQTALDLEPTNVASIMHAVIVDSRELARRYDKRVVLKITQELAPAAVDRVALRHSLYALLDMHIRSSEGPAIELLVHHQADSVMITFHDHGPALTFTQIQEVFKRLGKAARPVKQLPSSAGMAFYVAYSLTRAMGGDMTLKNSGSERRLSLKLPLSQQMELV